MGTLRVPSRMGCRGCGVQIGPQTHPALRLPHAPLCDLVGATQRDAIFGQCLRRTDISCAGVAVVVAAAPRRLVGVGIGCCVSRPSAAHHGQGTRAHGHEAKTA